MLRVTGSKELKTTKRQTPAQMFVRSLAGGETAGPKFTMMWQIATPLNSHIFIALIPK
jgi:hypothetical protein